MSGRIPGLIKNTKPRIVRGMDGRWVLFCVERVGAAGRREIARSCQCWEAACLLLRWLYQRGVILRDRG